MKLGFWFWGAIAAVVLLCAGHAARSWCNFYSPVEFNEHKFDRIVALIDTGQITPDEQGGVVLPPDLACLSVTGRAYVTDDLVFVPSWIGRRTPVPLPVLGKADERWVEGFLYSKKDLPLGSGALPTFLNVPESCEPWRARRETGVTDREMFIGDHVAKHWYEADSMS